MTNNEIALTMDAGALSELNELAKKSNTGGGGGGHSIPQLKIVQDVLDEDRGKWTVGMVKNKQGEVVDKGKIVKEFIILNVQCGYSRYNKKNKNDNCQSKLVNSFGDPVYGTTFNYQCGNTCPHRAKTDPVRCKAQYVLFGVAITEEGEWIDCIHYAKGSGFTPFMEIFDNTSDFFTVMNGGVKMPVEKYTMAIGLDSDMKKYDGTAYFAAKFTGGRFMASIGDDGKLDMSNIRKLYERHIKAQEYIDIANKQIVSKSSHGGEDDDAPAAKSYSGEIDITPSKSATREPVSKVDKLPEFDEELVSSDPNDADLEASVLAAIGKA